jgi:O-acetyl-ADP-ribose deacetylase (regulator of RNase III)
MIVRMPQGADMFADPADALVNTVNSLGRMGAGLAAKFKARFPHNDDLYVEACAKGEVQPGRMFVTSTAFGLPRYVINFPTKYDHRHPSRYEWIEAGLADLARWIPHLGLSSIAVPALGCDLGKLDWAVVLPMIESALAGSSAEVRIYPPHPKGRR